MWLNALRRRWLGRTRLFSRHWRALVRPAQVPPTFEALEDRSGSPAWVRAGKPPAFYNRGYAFYQKGEYKRAIADFSEAIRLCRPGEEYLPLRLRGLAYLRCGKYLEAIADFTQLLTLAPADAHAYACRGTAANAIGEYDRARADCAQALRLDPHSLLSYMTRNLALHCNSHTDKPAC